MIRCSLNDVFAAMCGLAAACGLVAAGCSDAPAENPPVRLVLAESGAEVPTTTVDDANGTVYFSWFGKDETDRTAVYVSRLADGTSAPSNPVQVNLSAITANAHGQAPAQVAVGPEGTVYVAWSTREVIEGRRFPASNLMLARSTDGGRSFEAPEFVNDDATDEPAGHTFHDLSVGADGTVYVSWLDSRHSRTEVRIAASRDRGRTFSPEVVVARGTCQCCRTAIAVSGSNVYLAWRHIYDDNIRDIAFARSMDGGRTFSEPIRVRTDGWMIEGCPHSGPSLTVDEDDAVHITWYTAADPSVGLHYAVSGDGGSTFTSDGMLQSDVPIAQAQLDGGSGPVWVAWEDPLSAYVYAGPANDRNTSMRFSGSAPAIASSEGVRSVVWQNRGRIEAYVARAHQ